MNYALDVCKLITLIACLNFLFNSSTAQAQNLIEIEPQTPADRTLFLASENAGTLGLLLEYGTGADEPAAKSGKKFQIARRGRCYSVPAGAVRNDSLWFMINNGKNGNDSGSVTLSVVTHHYRLGIASDSNRRKIDRTTRYSPIRFDINPQLDSSDVSNRVTFVANVEETDLMSLQLTINREGFGRLLTGQYYFVIKDRVAYETLIPGCRKGSAFGKLGG